MGGSGTGNVGSGAAGAAEAAAESGYIPPGRGYAEDPRYIPQHCGLSGFWGSFPVVGESSATYAAIRNGQWGWAIFHGAMAVSDFALVKGAAGAVFKIGLSATRNILAKDVAEATLKEAGEAAAKTTGNSIDDLVRAAQKEFPKKAGNIEQHHITPKYLGGDPKGPCAPLNAAYHQKITNAFRDAWQYGQKQPSPEELRQIIQDVYSKYPLPP